VSKVYNCLVELLLCLATLYSQLQTKMTRNVLTFIRCEQLSQHLMMINYLTYIQTILYCNNIKKGFC